MSAAFAGLATLLAGLLLVFTVLRVIRRSTREAAIPLIPIALATGWSALVLFLLRIPLNPMSAVMGALVIAISTEFSVLLSARYREERAGGAEPEEAIAATGQAGSQARFTISGNYLYTVNNSDMQVFDITIASNPVPWSKQSIGFGIETIFSHDQYLFIGSQNGIFIYDNSNPQFPTKVGSLLHARSCDPVVVEEGIELLELGQLARLERIAVACARGVEHFLGDQIHVEPFRNDERLEGIGGGTPVRFLRTEARDVHRELQLAGHVAAYARQRELRPPQDHGLRGPRIGHDPRELELHGEVVPVLRDEGVHAVGVVVQQLAGRGLEEVVLGLGDPLPAERAQEAVGVELRVAEQLGGAAARDVPPRVHLPEAVLSVDEAERAVQVPLAAGYERRHAQRGRWQPAELPVPDASTVAAIETVDLLRANLREWARDIRAERCKGAGIPGPPADCRGVDFYLVEVNLDLLADAEERTELKQLPTSLHLPAEAVDRLRAAARQLLRGSPEFQRFLADVHTTAKPGQP